MKANSTEKLKAKPAEQKFLFQFIDHETGHRSKPFTGTWDAVQEVLDYREKGEKPDDQDYILLVAIMDGEDTQIPSTPLITVKTFTSINSGEQ